MTKLVLHVGPGKCGSKSIQDFFATQKKPCIQKTNYILLNPLEIVELDCLAPSKSILNTIHELLSGNLSRCDVLILSHEYLFICPHAVRNICSLAQNLASSISVIGYSRKQSEFLISAYSQWWFRSPDVVNEASRVVSAMDLDPNLFSGLERQLIAFIKRDFKDSKLSRYFNNPRSSEYRVFDWFHSYRKISRLVRGSDAIIKCGTLPKKGSANTLIQDFCEKSDLILHDEVQEASQRILNASFNQEIVEAVNNAVVLGLDMPGPHESNEVLELLSSKMIPGTNNLSEFLSKLKGYIDTHFWGPNQQLCEEYGLSESYFVPSVNYSKSEILEMIMQEGKQRELNKSVVINNYRMLSAELIEMCLTKHS